MPATSVQPLITRIGEIMISGSGTSPYTITAGTFGLDWWYEGVDDVKRLAPHVLATPQAKITLTKMVDGKAWPRPSNQAMYNVEFEVALAYYTDSKILRNQKDKLASTIGNDIHKISKALQHPNNLRATNAGALTGLAGGLLEQQDENPEFEWNPEASVVTGKLVFTGFLVLSSSV